MNALRQMIVRAIKQFPPISRIISQRDEYANEVRRLNSEAKAALRADPPQRYVVNIQKYKERGGVVDLNEDVKDFVRGSENNATDLARYYAFCLIFDQIRKEGIAGDLAEIGVYKGHTAAILAKFARRSNRHLFLLDTYEGFSEKDLTGVDSSQPMQFADTSLSAVQAAVGLESVTFIKGFFPSTADHLPSDARYSLVHIDCDLYNPISAALNYFYPRMSPGGFLLIHDYSSLWWPGAEQAVDEFFRDKPERLIPMPDISGTVVVRRSY